MTEGGNYVEQSEIRDRIIKAFRQRVPRAKLPDPEQLRVEQGKLAGLRKTLSDRRDSGEKYAEQQRCL